MTISFNILVLLDGNKCFCLASYFIKIRLNKNLSLYFENTNSDKYHILLIYYEHFSIKIFTIVVIFIFIKNDLISIIASWKVNVFS